MNKPGRYNGRSTGVFRLGKATTGSTQIGIEFFAENDAGIKSRETWYGSLGSRESVELAAKAIEACTGQSLRSWAAFVEKAEKRADGSLFHSALTRCDVSLVFDDDIYEGKNRVRLSFVNPGGGVAMKDSLDRDSKELKSVPGALDKPRAQKAIPEGDDIPF